MTKPALCFAYRIRNWPEYNRALVSRGHCTWFDERGLRRNRASHRAGALLYADRIECALAYPFITPVYARPFLTSVMELMKLLCPSRLQYGESSAGRAQVQLSSSLCHGSRHIVIDSRAGVTGRARQEASDAGALANLHRGL
jgi:hypothetical protein